LKCCCFQEVTVRKPGEEELIGHFRENYFCSVAQFSIDDKKGEKEMFVREILKACCTIAV
jgi:hypothetical protein